MELKNGRKRANRGVIAVFAIVAIFCLSSIAWASIVPVNSNSKVLDGIEYYIQTDKFTYQLGENVEMLFKVTNLNDYSVTFHIPFMPEYDFWVQKDGVEIWSKGNGFLPVAGQFTLEQYESWICPGLNTPYLWNMRDSANNLVGLGTYNVIGGIAIISEPHIDTTVSVPIQIVPEPSTIFLLITGLFGICIKKHRN